MLFERGWTAHLQTLPARYRKGHQLRVGSRFRPLLVCWGHILSGDSFCLSKRKNLAGLAIYIELLHKATLLIDDLIDGDSARHGYPTFHVEFGDHDSILFAIYLLGDCLEKLTASSLEGPTDSTCSELSTLLSRAIKEMALGGIKEIHMNQKHSESVSKIKRIVELQTIALVKNGLLTGFRVGRGHASTISSIESLGYDAGYFFQLLNDAEPFMGAEKNIEYKGAANSDISRSRKNLVLAFLFNRLKEKDRKKLKKIWNSPSSESDAQLREWFIGYGMADYLCEHLLLLGKNIDKTTDSIPVEASRKEGFKNFVLMVMSKAVSRFDEPNRQRLSPILTR